MGLRLPCSRTVSSLSAGPELVVPQFLDYLMAHLDSLKQGKCCRLLCQISVIQGIPAPMHNTPEPESMLLRYLFMSICQGPPGDLAALGVNLGTGSHSSSLNSMLHRLHWSWCGNTPLGGLLICTMCRKSNK